MLKHCSFWNKKRAKAVIVTATITYILLLPVSLAVVAFSPMVFDHPNISSFWGLCIIFQALLVPISLLVSLKMIWRKYYDEQYQSVFFYLCLPMFTIGSGWSISMLIVSMM